MTTISSVSEVDLSKYSRLKLLEMEYFLTKQQRWSGGFQELLKAIEAELAKPNRPADATPDSAA